MVVDPFDAILGRLDGVHEREVEHLVRGVARQGAQHGEGLRLRMLSVERTRPAANIMPTALPC